MENLDQSGRTRGDGMEFIDTSTTDNKIKQVKPAAPPQASTSSTQPNSIKNLELVKTQHPIPGLNLIYRGSQDLNQASPPAQLPTGKIFNLIPRLIASNRKYTLKTKEPRFVPFEPYKAAINPLVPLKKIQKIKLINRNNLDLNTLVSHMSDMKMSDLKALTSGAEADQSSEKSKYEREITELKRERDSVSMQLKSQVQVNTELKNLLVAAVGEDLQTRVNVLTEDKLELARALLSSAQNLSSHTEQIEFLAGQSEVWRSKFLASSLMVEELARWKASLMYKNKLLLESNKQLLETMSTLREMELQTLTNLKFLSNVKTINLQSSNVTDVTAECLNISQQLILHSGIGMPAAVDVSGLDTTTNAEKLAVTALQNSNEPLMSTDEAFKAIVGQAFSSYGRIPVDTTVSTDNQNNNSIK